MRALGAIALAVALAGCCAPDPPPPPRAPEPSRGASLRDDVVWDMCDTILPKLERALATFTVPADEARRWPDGRLRVRFFPVVDNQTAHHVDTHMVGERVKTLLVQSKKIVPFVGALDRWRVEVRDNEVSADREPDRYELTAVITQEGPGAVGQDERVTFTIQLHAIGTGDSLLRVSEERKAKP